jgi:hypothetical protein
MTSKMPTVYLHYFGTESAKKLLEAKGVIQHNIKSINVLKSKPCPNCSEPNKPDAQFCMKCKMVLSYNSYKNTLEEKQRHEDEVKGIREEMNQKFDLLMSWIQQNPKLALVKPEALLRKSLT